LTAGNPLLARTSASAPSGAHPDARPRILLIDDEEEAWLVCKAHLEYHSPNAYALSWARTFDDGLDAALRNQHDLYIVDVFLGSGPTGIELIERARAAGNRVPMIVLTRYANPALDHRSLAAGGTDYLDKSEITGPLFERTIRYALERARAERRIRFQAALLDAVGQAVVATDPDGTIQYWNEAAARLYGWTWGRPNHSPRTPGRARCASAARTARSSRPT
jgi:DNA-binding response OmpR family regulator